MPEQIDQLLAEIQKTRTEFKSESYPMSIGELVSLYERNEIIIAPAFQRLFRWSDTQKSKLIESILLGIPVPSIFVFQREDGIWELVDGLQRLSTLIQFMGKLQGKPPLKLLPTKYLPSLENMVWEQTEEEQVQIPDSLKLYLKRAKLNLTIILSETGTNAKFEVFQRLNTGGTNASDQEVRNSVMIMSNEERYTWLKDLSTDFNFKDTISLSDRLIEEQYPMELALRHIALTYYEYSPKKELSDFFDEITETILAQQDFPSEEYGNSFKRTFTLLNQALGEDAFKRFDGHAFKGKFLESAFEAVTVGLASNIGAYEDGDLELIRQKVQELHGAEIFQRFTGSGTNAKTRIPNIVPFAKHFFRK